MILTLILVGMAGIVFMWLLPHRASPDDFPMAISPVGSTSQSRSTVLETSITPKTNPALSGKASPLQTHNLLWGVYAGYRPADVANFEKLVNAKAQLVGVFVHWGNENNFPSDFGPTVRDEGKTLVIYWEPMDYNDSSLEQSKFNYDSILAGQWDNYFRQFASEAKSYNGPVILLPFDEMNGNWSPWSGTLNGNSPAKAILAWRYIHNFFSDVPKLKFGWAVNNDSVPNTQGNQIADYYPGDKWVDYVGIDGFNFGDPWQTWEEVFSSGLDKLAVYQKPIYIFSTASAPGPEQATWIKDGLGQATLRYPLLVGWIWFNESKERDWRADSSPATLDAFRHTVAGLSSSN